MFYYMNDYELLDLIHGEKSDLAFAFLVQKYRYLMLKVVDTYVYDYGKREEYMQEALVMLYKAVCSFRTKYQKSFTRYYELILKRHLFHMLKREPQYVLKESLQGYQSARRVVLRDYDFLKTCTKLERLVFVAHYYHRLPIAQIAAKLEVPVKKIYNAIFRLKQKAMSYYGS